MSNIYYHYCGLSTFYSIVETQSFWLTTLNSSLDKKEMVMSKKIVDKVKKEFNDLEYNSKIKDNGSYYALSLTKGRDNSTHFDSYGQGKTGVCIGIDKEAFVKYFEHEEILDIMQKVIMFEDVIYNQNEQEEIVRSYINYYNTDEYKVFHQILLKTAEIIHKPLFKTSNYKDEKEIRVVFYKDYLNALKYMFKDMYKEDEQIILDYKDNIIDLIEKNIVKNDKSILGYNMELRMKKIEEDLFPNNGIKYGLIANNIRKYHVFNFSKLIKYGFISEIIVGSKSNQNIKELKSFLKSKGINCKVTKSSM